MPEIPESYVLADYPRDMCGYGPHPPAADWPGGAYIAVQCVLNYEEGSENSIVDGDGASETFLSEMTPAEAFSNRHMSMESLYEYGSRVGVWRILRLCESKGIPLTIFAVARALQRNPLVAQECLRLGHEIASHGLRWKSYQQVDPVTEYEHMQEAMRIITELTGSRPVGWYTGRDSPQTLELVTRFGGFLYSSDSYADDLPYWVRPLREHEPQLIIPYTLETNDMRFASPAGFANGEQFYQHIKDAFDVLYREGVQGAPKLLNIGLHCRIIGRPARLAALERLFDYMQGHPGVWFARRMDIACHWRELHPYSGN